MQTPEWAAAKRKILEEDVWAAEFDIDYSASVEGICIPAKWVESATRVLRYYYDFFESSKMLGAEMHKMFVGRFRKPGQSLQCPCLDQTVTAQQGGFPKP